MTFRPYNQLTASGVSDTRTNNSGITFNKGTPVRIDSTGELDFINVSVEAEALAVAGIVSETILDGNPGTFLNSGKIEDVTTSTDFGDTLYISKSGSLTNTKPSIGVDGFVAGDFVISVGVIAKNESNPILKDLVLNIDVVGQL